MITLFLSGPCWRPRQPSAIDSCVKYNEEHSNSSEGGGAHCSRLAHGHSGYYQNCLPKVFGEEGALCGPTGKLFAYVPLPLQGW